MRYLYQPMSHLLNDMFGTYSQLGMWGTTDPHVWVFQQPTTNCRRRCPATARKQRCQRPVLWEETIDVSNLKPETIEVRSEEGTMLIHGVLRGEKTNHKAGEASQEISKRVPLPEGLLTPSLRCYIAGGKIHVLGMVLKPQKKSGDNTAEKRTAKNIDETAPDDQTKEGYPPAESVAEQDRKECPCEGETTTTCKSTDRCAGCPMREGCCAETPTESCPMKQGCCAETEKKDEADTMDFEMVAETGECCHHEGDDDDAVDAESLDLEASESLAEDGYTDVSVAMGDVPTRDHSKKSEDLMEDDNQATDADVSKELQDTETNTVAASTDNTSLVPDKHFQKKFNLHGFEPSEMKVRLSGRHLTVTAEHREEEDDYVNFRQYRQTVTLPDDVILPDVTSHLSSEGVLEISAPLANPELPGERILDIRLQFQ